jgi:alpha-galactosidase
MRRLLLATLILSITSVWSQKKSLALTPPMGWNSWNTFRCEGLNEQLVKQIADRMVENGMRDAGYVYINLDDCWQIGRDANGQIIVDTLKFPSGIKSLADYVHGKGLKLGIYSDVGLMTCQRRPGGRYYEEIDAKTYSDWGIDYLKYDFCFLPKSCEQGKESRKTRSLALSYLKGPKGCTAEEMYAKMGTALSLQDRDIVFSICNWGVQNPWEWAGKMGHLWRTTGDIRPYFKGINFKYIGFYSIHKIIKIADKKQLHLYAKPGQWNDPDMLEVGNGKLTFEENKTHFSMWAIMAAPLLAGNDLRSMNNEVLSILTNKSVIAINQDAKGVQGYKVETIKGVQIWIKPLSNEKWAVCFYNPQGKKHIRYNFNRLSLTKPLTKWHNVWEEKQLPFNNEFKLSIPKHGSVLFVVE